MESTEITVYDHREKSAYHRHFESTGYHPLLLFNDKSDCLASKLCAGNIHRAAGWEELFLPEIDRQQARVRRRLALPRAIRKWSLTSLQQRLVKTEGRLIKDAQLVAASNQSP